jgi:hypothetical protein
MNMEKVAPGEGDRLPFLISVMSKKWRQCRNSGMLMTDTFHYHSWKGMDHLTMVET